MSVPSAVRATALMSVPSENGGCTPCAGQHPRRFFLSLYPKPMPTCTGPRLCAQGWEDAVANWREIPKGKQVKAIWYNHAIVPLWAAIGLASVVCGGFMIKYFAGHTEISWSKSMRATYDHQGLSESRVASHNSHFGFRSLNKKDFSIFPFKFTSMGSIAEKHGVVYAKEE